MSYYFTNMMKCATCFQDFKLNKYQIYRRKKLGQTLFYCSHHCRARNVNKIANRRRFKILKSELEKLYLKDNLSIMEIANRCGFSITPVYKALIKYGIPLKPLGWWAKGKRKNLSKIPPKEILEKLYCEDGLSITQIANRYNIGHVTTRNALTRYGIPLKPQGWWLIGKRNHLYGRTDHIKYPLFKPEGLKHFVRSKWEAIFAQWLQNQFLTYIYEPKVFPFEVSYRPDFYVFKWRRFIEIKGYWRPGAKYKFLTFCKLFPDTILLESKAIKAIKQNSSINTKALLKLATSLAQLY